MEKVSRETKAKLAYEIISGRRAVCDSIYWQLPAILLVGEAFLFQITLGDGTQDFAIILGSLLGILFCAVVHFSFWRNHVSEKTLASMLNILEEENGWFVIHNKSTKYTPLLPGYHDFTLETQKLLLLEREYPYLYCFHKVSISTAWYFFFLVVYVIHIIVVVCRVRFND